MELGNEFELASVIARGTRCPYIINQSKGRIYIDDELSERGKASVSDPVHLTPGLNYPKDPEEIAENVPEITYLELVPLCAGIYFLSIRMTCSFSFPMQLLFHRQFWEASCASSASVCPTLRLRRCRTLGFV